MIRKISCNKYNSHWKFNSNLTLCESV